MTARRIAQQPAYVLHHYDWSESSLILETFTRQHGRVALVAKGAKRPSSSLRPVLRWGGDAEIRTLKSAEWAGGHVMPTGQALLSGYYANELLMRLLARDDAHPALFDAYAALVHTLALHSGAAGQADVLHAALRAFELLLLRETGHLPALNAQTLTLAPVQAGARYCLVPEGGLRQATDGDGAWLDGAHWLALHHALQERGSARAPFAAVLAACAALGAARSRLLAQLRGLLHYHCGRSLRTRQMMAELQQLQSAAAALSPLSSSSAPFPADPESE